MTRDLTDDIDDILDSITNRQIETSIKKSRGLNGRSQWLIKNMIPIVRRLQSRSLAGASVTNCSSPS
jgi:hypothetical protein